MKHYIIEKASQGIHSDLNVFKKLSCERSPLSCVFDGNLVNIIASYNLSSISSTIGMENLSFNIALFDS